MRKKIIFLLFLGIILAFLLNHFLTPRVLAPEQISPSSESVKNLENTPLPFPETTIITSQDKQSAISPSLLNVPFFAQAPLGNWSDPIFQNACEEASLLMATAWLNKQTTLSPKEVAAEIKKIAKFENEFLGYNADTDLDDLEKILQKYPSFSGQSFQVKVQKNISLEDLKETLSEGKIILAPMFGRALKNPFFTSPGPITHMLVIISYDRKTQEFIVNDPGTKRGAGFRYPEKTLFSALWEYPGGKNHPDVPQPAQMKKSILIISKK
jgi:hypothetical protein